MNLRKFVTWPWPVQGSVHVRVEDFLSSSNSAVALSHEETWRAAQIRSVAQRNAFMASCRFAREVLSGPLNCEPEAVPIVSEPNGKLGTLRGRIQFNLSYCQEWCVVDWSAVGSVGADVEVIRPVMAMAEIANNFFPAVAQRASGGGLDDTCTCLDQVSRETCDTRSCLGGCGR